MAMTHTTDGAMIDTVDGVVRRVRPIVLTDSDAPGWCIQARGQTFTPQRKLALSPRSYCERERTYAYDRLKYPMIREDFVETPDGAHRNTENRGKSGYRRASWDEALSLVAREIRRLQKTYGPASMAAYTDAPGDSGLVSAKPSLFARFFSLLGYTRILDKERYKDNTPGPFLCTDTLETALQSVETAIYWGSEPKNMPDHTLWHRWMQDLGIQCIYISAFRDASALSYADKWIGPRVGTDAAVFEAIAYVWITEDSYDKAFIREHGHRFGEFCAYILGRGPDATPKTPQWAAARSLVPAMDIKAIARRWAHTVTAVFCDGTQDPDCVHLLTLLSAMQGRPCGQSGGAPVNLDFWFGRVGDPLSSLANVPVCEQPAVNPVGQLLYLPLFPDAIVKGHCTWRDGTYTQHVYPALGCAPVHGLWHCGASLFRTNTDPRALTAALQSPELQLIISQDTHFGPDSRHADILLPACSALERVDIGAYTDPNWQVILYQAPALEPLWDTQPDYWILSQVAARLGFAAAFTEGRTEEDWARRMFLFSDLPKAISWEDFRQKGYYILPFSENPDAHSTLRALAPPDAPVRDLNLDLDLDTPVCTDWHRPPDSPSHVNTFTGKVEFVSESQLYWAPYLTQSQPYQEIDTSDSYPYTLLASPARPQDRPGPVCHIHADVARQKGIANGDVVRLYNERGSMLCVARPSYRLWPETVHVYASSGDPDTAIGLLSPLPCAIQIEKAEKASCDQGWAHILEAVDRQQREIPRPLRTSAAADLLQGG